MFKKALDFVDVLVLLYDENLLLTWENKAFTKFKQENIIQNSDEFIQCEQVKAKHDLNPHKPYCFEHYFNDIGFDVKFTCIDEKNIPDKFMITCSPKVDEKTLYQLKYIDSISMVGNRELHVKKLSEFYAKQALNPKLNMIAFGINFKNFEKLDYFFGYDVGNEVLRKIAKSLQQLTAHDMVFRISGTQFVLMYEFEDENFDVNAYTKKVVDIFKKPMQITEETSMQLFTSIGVIVVPQDATNNQDFLKHLALAYAESVKRYEKVSMVFYDKNYGKTIIRNLKLERRLEKALSGNHLELFYQPKIKLKDKSIHGFEALLRWRDPELGFVSPLDFISIAEETGQIVQIGAWVLKQVCLQSNEWKKQGFELKISLNVSIRQLQDPNFFNIFTGILNETKVDVSLIELEITESILSDNLQETIDLFNEIRKLGLSISLDDFGTGYSSLSYLRNIPIDVLKIDKAFVDNVCLHDEDAAIAKTIVALAQALSLQVVAEGVEDEEQVLFLEKINCDLVQGYYYYKPLNLKDTQKLLDNL